MMNLLSLQSVVVDLELGDRKDVLQYLSARAAALIEGYDEGAIFDMLLERERIGATAIGGGAAIPQARLPELDRVLAGI